LRGFTILCFSNFHAIRSIIVNDLTIFVWQRTPLRLVRCEWSTLRGSCTKLWSHTV